MVNIREDLPEDFLYRSVKCNPLSIRYWGSNKESKGSKLIFPFSLGKRNALHLSKGTDFIGIQKYLYPSPANIRFWRNDDIPLKLECDILWREPSISSQPGNVRELLSLINPVNLDEINPQNTILIKPNLIFPDKQEDYNLLITSLDQDQRKVYIVPLVFKECLTKLATKIYIWVYWSMVALGFCLFLSVIANIIMNIPRYLQKPSKQEPLGFPQTNSQISTEQITLQSKQDSSITSEEKKQESNTTTNNPDVTIN